MCAYPSLCQLQQQYFLSLSFSSSFWYGINDYLCHSKTGICSQQLHTHAHCFDQSPYLNSNTVTTGLPFLPFSYIPEFAEAFAFYILVLKLLFANKRLCDKISKQAGAELCQAQEKLGLANWGCLPFTLKLRSSSIYLEIVVVFHSAKN